MGSPSQERPVQRIVAAVLCGLLSVSTLTPYAFAQHKPTAAAAGKKPAKPADHAGKKPAGHAARPAHAGEKKPTTRPLTDTQRKAAARKHYEEGIKRLGNSDFAGALPEFQAANELIPSPAANNKIALCHESLGHTAEAIAAYEKFVAEAPAEKMAEQIADARKHLSALKSAPVTVNASSEPTGVSIWVDGTPHETTSPTELRLAPGKHKIRMAAAGYEAREIEIEIKPGEKAADIKLTLASASVSLPPMPVASTPPAPAPAPVVPQKKNNLPAYVTLGVAGAGAVVGTIFGFKALSDKNSFNDHPTTGNADNAERNALVADMAFGIALTLGVTGTVLLLGGNKTDEASKTAAASRSTMTRFSPYVGPSGGGASAVFSF